MSREPDDDLRRLLADAVDRLEPGDGLTPIRDRIRTHEKVTPMSNRRPWLYAVTGAVAATAAVIAAVAVAGGTLTGEEDPSPAAAPSSPAPDAEPTPTDGSAEPSAAEPGPAGDPVAVTVHYVGDGPRGPVLYRELQQVQVTADAPEAEAAAQAAVGGAPLDPDYRSAWPAGSTVTDVVVEGGLARVDLAGVPTDRPSGTSQREAELAVQQVVWSVQEAVQERVPVRLTVDGASADRVLGVPTAEPLTAGPALEVLSLMSITTPREGADVSGTFTAEGLNNSFEATVVWEVLDASGAVVADGFGTAEGYMEERLFPWRVDVDVSGLAPGTYTFVARNDDPSGGAEGNGPASDDRTIVVQ